MGVVDIVVNNAGMQHVAAVQDFDYASWDKVLKLNLTSAYVLSKAVLPGMVKAKFGRVINIASGASTVRRAPPPLPCCFLCPGSARLGGLRQQVRVRGEQARHRGFHQSGTLPSRLRARVKWLCMFPV